MNTSQKPNERKQQYKLLLDHVLNIRERDIESDSPMDVLLDVQQSIKNNDKIHHEVVTSAENFGDGNAEVVMDIQILKNIHEIISKVFTCNSDFNDSMYTNALKALIYRNDTANWDAIGELAVRVSRTTYTTSSMLGGMDIELQEHVVKERQKRNKSTIAKEKRPKSINKLKRNDPGAEKLNIALKQINEIFKANNYQPIPYYKLIIDPNNFMNTVDNALQLSFLVRDGDIGIKAGCDSYPQVYHVPKNSIPHNGATSQAISSLSIGFCEKMARLYNIEKPLLQIPEDLDDSDSTDANDDDDE